MKKCVALSFVGLLVAACVLITGAGMAYAQGNGIVASATGSGMITLDGKLRTFSFTAHRDGSNNSSGQLELFNRSTGVRFHGAINCLHVAGNVATMSGTITEVNSTASELGFIGEPFWVQVVDNGEGANAAPDMISGVAVLLGGAVPCSTTDFVPANLTVEAGNIQVH